jgi:uncharacterized protein (TIGR03435 family)
MEDRPVNAMVLRADRPKLTKADPASRIRCSEGPAPETKDPRTGNPILSRLVTCQNITMAQLADRLPSIAGGYVRTPVADETGLEGGWNFTFNFSPAGAVQGALAGRGGDPAAGGAPLAASDPTGALTLQESLSRQLGLKLETERRTLQVFVIDSMEQKPTDN